MGGAVYLIMQLALALPSWLKRLHTDYTAVPYLISVLGLLGAPAGLRHAWEWVKQGWIVHIQKSDKDLCVKNLWIHQFSFYAEYVSWQF